MHSTALVPCEKNETILRESVRTGLPVWTTTLNPEFYSMFFFTFCVCGEISFAHMQTGASSYTYRQQSSHIRSTDAKTKSRQGIGDIETEMLFRMLCLWCGSWKRKREREKERTWVYETLRKLLRIVRFFSLSISRIRLRFISLFFVRECDDNNFNIQSNAIHNINYYYLPHDESICLLSIVSFSVRCFLDSGIWRPSQTTTFFSSPVLFSEYIFVFFLHQFFPVDVDTPTNDMNRVGVKTQYFRSQFNFTGVHHSLAGTKISMSYSQSSYVVSTAKHSSIFTNFCILSHSIRYEPNVLLLDESFCVESSMNSDILLLFT